MKKVVFILVILFLFVFMQNTTINASDLENNETVQDTTIVKFDYFPGGSLTSDRKLTFIWFSLEEMTDLVIKLYTPKEQAYVEIFNINWDLESMESDFDVNLKLLNRRLMIQKHQRLMNHEVNGGNINLLLNLKMINMVC